VDYNPLHDQFFPSIGCAPCTRAISLGETSAPGAGGGKTKPPRNAAARENQTREPPHERPYRNPTAAAEPSRPNRRTAHHLSNRHLDALEEETIFILREVAAAFERPALLFSGGKDSLVMLKCAEKAFGAGAGIPYPLLMIDTGHNFPEVTDFPRLPRQGTGRRTDRAQRGRFDGARHRAPGAPGRARNVHQSVTLLEAIEEFRFDALIGGARRDEEKARAKERIFSHRDSFGQWQPKAQRPELWTLFNTRLQPGEHFRVFPISNWTELDVWQYIDREQIALPSLYYTHQRQVVDRKGLLVPVTELTPPRDGETVVETRDVRFRTVGDITCTCPVESPPPRRRHRDRDPGRRRERARRHPHGRQDQRRLDGKAQERRVLLMTNTTPFNTTTCNAYHSSAGKAKMTISPPCKFITCGSVDDGKSTLIGRLLVDSKAVLQDHLAGVQRQGETDLALLTDGLSAEREQGITIDVAYRYFATEDAQVHHWRRARPRAVHPQHGDGRQQRRRRRGAGRRHQARLANPALALLPQTRRHSLLVHLLRVPSLVFAVNKLDAVADPALAFAHISGALATFAQAAGIAVRATVPVSALKGWNVVDAHAGLVRLHRPHAAAGAGSSCPTRRRHGLPLAFPVQWVEKFSSSSDTSRAAACSGAAWPRARAPGTPVQVFPSGQTGHRGPGAGPRPPPQGVPAGTAPASSWTARWTSRAATGLWPRPHAAAAPLPKTTFDTPAATTAWPASRELRPPSPGWTTSPWSPGRVYWALHGHRWVKAKVKARGAQAQHQHAGRGRRHAARAQRHRPCRAAAARAASRRAVCPQPRAGIADPGGHRQPQDLGRRAGLN
jgi:sulfate adenylyltransferase subunit 2